MFLVFFFSFHRLQEHLENECMSAAWLLVFSDVLGHHCHLLSAEVTTKQFDLSLCTSDRPLSGLDFPNKMICRQSEFCHDLFVAGRRAKRKTEGPVFNCLLPVSNLSGTSLGRQKKRKTWISLVLAQHKQNSSSVSLDSRAPRSNKIAKKTTTTTTKKAIAYLAQVG